MEVEEKNIKVNVPKIKSFEFEWNEKQIWMVGIGSFLVLIGIDGFGDLIKTVGLGMLLYVALTPKKTS